MMKSRPPEHEVRAIKGQLDRFIDSKKQFTTDQLWETQLLADVDPRPHRPWLGPYIQHLQANNLIRSTKKVTWTDRSRPKARAVTVWKGQPHNRKAVA